MAKITFMGAGSTIFARNVLGDSMGSQVLCGSEIALYDIDAQRLEDSQIILNAINHNVNQAIKLGVDPITAISIATINAAKHFRVDQDYGSLTPGRYADIILCRSIEDIQPEQVWFEGRKVFEEGKVAVEKIERTMDGIRDKFGKTAITPTRLQNKGHHERPIPPGPKRDVSGE